MMIHAMTAMLIGAVLGLRFKVIILIPAIIIGSAATLSIGMAHSSNLWLVLPAMVTAITMLQLGYLGGTIVRFVVARARVHSDSPATIAVAQRPAR